MTEVDPAHALRDLQRLRRGMANHVDPHVIDEAIRVNHEHVVLPLADRSSEPRTRGTRRWYGTSRQDLAVVVELLVEDQRESRRLDDLEGLWNSDRFRKAMRETSSARHVLAAILPALLEDRFSSRRHRCNVRPSGIPDIPSATERSPPDAREIRLAVRRARRGSRQIRRAVRPPRGAGQIE